MHLFLMWLAPKLQMIPGRAWKWLAVAIAVVLAVWGFYSWSHGRGYDEAKAEWATATARAEADRVERQAKVDADQAKRNAAYAEKSDAAAKTANALNSKIAGLVAKQKRMSECDVPAEDKAALNEQIEAANDNVDVAGLNELIKGVVK
jgi:hypothetical protein